MYENDNELQHYGVLGMKWGVRKAKSYSSDLNKHRYKQSVKKSKRKLKKGEINRATYNAQKKKFATQRKKADARDTYKLDTLTPEKGKKIKSIYESYKHKAYSEIPHYAIKKGAKTAGKILVATGLGVLTMDKLPPAIINKAGLAAISTWSEFANGPGGSNPSIHVVRDSTI